MSEPFDYIKRTYGVTPSIGQRVTVYGKPGIIVADKGHYIGVNFDSDKPSMVKSAHPVDGVEYLGQGKIRKPSRGAARYQEFLRADYYTGTFIEFCMWMDSRKESAQ